MPRNAAAQVVNNFTRGLITEATGLNFPEDACTETENCVFHESGYMTRRYGFDYEDGYDLSSVTRDGDAVAEYMWDSVAGTGTLSFAVVQLGDIIHFFQVDEDGALSANKKSFTVDLDTFKVSGSPAVNTEPCSFTDGNGYLFVTHKYCEPFYVLYNPDTDGITSTAITIKIRDFAGIVETTAIDNRPSTLTTTHNYNLYNQGWYITARTILSGNMNVLTYWDNQRVDFPSNADVWWLYKLADVEGGDAGIEEFSVSKVDTIAVGNTPAPKGHYVLDAFREDRATASGIVGPSVITSSYYRPTCNAFSSGRVLYSGVSYQGYSNKIWFSRVIENTGNFGQCYQDNDPTSENISDLLPTDGGVIVIPEAGAILKLVPIQGYILVFASNGIWAISGREGVGFAANDYAVRRISSVPALSGSSFVINKNGLPLWWNVDGIYSVVIDQVSSTIDVTTLTEKTIKTFFDDIPAQSKAYAKGAFNPLDNVIQWIYRSTTTTDQDELYEYDMVLTLNVLTGAFYPWTITQPNNGPKIIGLVVAKGSGSVVEEEIVVDNTDDTVVNGVGATVTADVTTSIPLSSSFRFLTSIPDSGTTYDFTFSLANNTDFFDWVTFQSADEYVSYAITGYKVHGEAQKKFQANDIFFYFLAEDDASCFVQGIWDYANDPNSGRYTTEQQIVGTRSNYGIQRARRTIRGRGYSLQLKFLSESDKPFTLHGWSSFETGASLP
jgi:hypothetical protein